MKKKGFGFFIQLCKEAFGDFGKDKVLKMAASLAYGTTISMPGLLIVILWVSGIFYDPAEVKGQLFSLLNDQLGLKTVVKLQDVLISTKFDYVSLWAKILGIATLVLGATGIFGEIQDSINTIWGLKAKPKSGVLKIFINRLLSFSILIVLGFILIVSLAVNALISSFFDGIHTQFPGVPIAVYYIVNQLVICVVLILLFGAIFKVLPDAKIKWKDVLLSSAITTVLFMIGKLLMGIILAKNATVSAYGSAGSVIVILLWVYYSSAILYLGAEFTQAYLRLKGRHIEPNKYAVWVEKKEVQVGSNLEAEKKTVK